MFVALLRPALTLSLATAATLMVVAGSAAPVRAADLRTAVVHTHNLDLATVAGRAAIDDQVRQAARRVCANPDARGLNDRLVVQHCARAAIADARPQRDRLVAAAASRTLLADAAPVTTSRR